MARAAATAYEVIPEWEDAGERINNLHPLKLKQKKPSLLIDDDDDDEDKEAGSLSIK